MEINVNSIDILNVAINQEIEGEIFYRQQRMGKDGKVFGLLKFATMLKDSPSIGTGDITLKNDPRVLPIGKYLRKTKINELPQILNILKGEMSIIGPRPLTPNNFNYYTDEVKNVLIKMRPGLSGVGSVVFRDEESLFVGSELPYHEFYKKYISTYKGDLEVWYYNNKSILLDIKLIMLTIYIIIRPGKDIHEYINSLPEKPFFLH